MYTRFLRDSGAGSGGGTGLLNLVNELNDFNNPVNLDEPAPPDPKEEEAAKLLAAQQEELKKEAFANDGTTLKPGYVKDDNGIISKDPNYTPPAEETDVEGADENGEPLPGYKKDADGKIVKDPDYVEQELTQEEEEKEFFKQIGEITGDNFEIEWPEEITDKLSPAGIAHLISEVREDAAVKFEAYLQTKDPRAYAYMLHRQKGLSDEEFLGTNKGFVLPSVEELEASADLQSAVYKFDLKSKGLDDDTIDVLVNKAITDNKLKERAEASFKFIEKEQTDQMNELARQAKEREDATNAAINSFVNKVDKTIGSDLRFVIPEADKKAFRDFVVANMRYDETTGAFSVVQKLGDDLNTVLESLFFQHKKGNLKALVEKQAKTKTAQGIRARIGSRNAAPGNGSGGGKQDEDFIPLSAMTVNTVNQ